MCAGRRLHAAFSQFQWQLTLGSRFDDNGLFGQPIDKQAYEREAMARSVQRAHRSISSIT